MKNKNHKQAYIIDILNLFPITNNKIYIKNQNFKVIYSKFLDISFKILEDDTNSVEPTIIINQKDIEEFGNDKELI